MAELFGFEDLKRFANRLSTKVLFDGYTGRYSVATDYYSSPLYRSHRATRGWNPNTSLWGYSINYQDSIVCRVFGDQDVGDLLEDRPPTWVQYTRTAIRNAVAEATGEHTTPCIPGTVDGIFWYGHNYVRHYQNFANIPLAMLTGQLPYESTGDDSHGWFAGVKRRLINSIWEDADDREERNAYALNDLCEYAGYVYSLAYHVCQIANWHTEYPTLSALQTAAMFSNYWQIVMRRRVYHPVAVKYYQEESYEA